MAISAAKLEEALVGLNETWRGSGDDSGSGWEDVRVLERVDARNEDSWICVADCLYRSTGRSIYASLDASRFETRKAHVALGCTTSRSWRIKRMLRHCLLLRLAATCWCTTTSFTRPPTRCRSSTSHFLDEAYRHQTTSMSSLCRRHRSSKCRRLA